MKRLKPNSVLTVQADLKRLRGASQFELKWEYLLTPMQRDIVTYFEKNADSAAPGTWPRSLIKNPQFIGTYGNVGDTLLHKELGIALIALGITWDGIESEHRRTADRSDQRLQEAIREQQSKVAESSEETQAEIASLIDELVARRDAADDAGMKTVVVALLAAFKCLARKQAARPQLIVALTHLEGLRQEELKSIGEGLAAIEERDRVTQTLQRKQEWLQQCIDSLTSEKEKEGEFAVRVDTFVDILTDILNETVTVVDIPTVMVNDQEEELTSLIASCRRVRDEVLRHRDRLLQKANTIRSALDDARRQLQKAQEDLQANAHQRLLLQEEGSQAFTTSDTKKVESILRKIEASVRHDGELVSQMEKVKTTITRKENDLIAMTPELGSVVREAQERSVILARLLGTEESAADFGISRDLLSVDARRTFGEFFGRYIEAFRIQGVIAHPVDFLISCTDGSFMERVLKLKRALSDNDLSCARYGVGMGMEFLIEHGIFRDCVLDCEKLAATYITMATNASQPNFLEAIAGQMGKDARDKIGGQQALAEIAGRPPLAAVIVLQQRP